MLHNNYDSELVYPNLESIDSAIYDMDKRYIFGTFLHKPILDTVSGRSNEEIFYYVTSIAPYYLGAAYLLVAKPVQYAPIKALQKTIVWFVLGGGILFSILGIFLGKLFIAPMRESMRKMNRFIQDATHELNTPISTILTNIEMLETFGKCAKNEELKRIEIASKTLSSIYDDLTYLNLNHKYYRNIQEMDFSALLHERFLYFKVMAESKELVLDIAVDPDIRLFMDKNDAVRLIDNLIANAIKYNHPKGLLSIRLTKEFLLIKDTGIGIKEKDLDMIFQRFQRANSSEGGFGIGLDIVNQVIRYYGFDLSLKSTLHQGTEVKVKWSK